MLRVGDSAAETVISGEISPFVTWSEDIYFFDADGSAMSISGLTFYLQFRSETESTGADITLSTSNDLSLVADSGGTTSILRISSDAGTFSAYAGTDMIVDLVAVDVSDNSFHYGHGVVSITNDPVSI
jgi:hypothetical protein